MHSVSLEEGMHDLDMSGIHEDHKKRVRAAHPCVSDLRIALDTAAEMQVVKRARSTYSSLSKSLSAMEIDTGAAAPQEMFHSIKGVGDADAFESNL